MKTERTRETLIRYASSLPAGSAGRRTILADLKMALDLPSKEKGGKESYDDDFKAGFKAGDVAYKKDDQVSAADGEKAYKRVSKKHGNWWEDGYSAAIDMARGADKTKPAQIAKMLGLKTAKTKGFPMKTITASDRKSLIRLASTMAVGSHERRAILAGLKKAKPVGWESLVTHFMDMGQDSRDDAEDELESALDELDNKVDDLLVKATYSDDWDMEMGGNNEASGKMDIGHFDADVETADMALEGPFEVFISTSIYIKWRDLRVYGEWFEGAGRLRGVQAYLIDRVKDRSEDVFSGNDAEIHGMADKASDEVKDMTSVTYYTESGDDPDEAAVWEANSDVPVVDEIKVEMDRGGIHVSVAAEATTNMFFLPEHQ